MSTSSFQRTTRAWNSGRMRTGNGGVVSLQARRELRSWIAAAEWLNGHGYAAAVPAELVPPLTRRGLAVWDASGRDAA